jgi:signal transduction histidine kinase
VGWLMAGRVLRSLRKMTAATRRISADSLHQRLGVAGPDDELLVRLAAVFDTQKDALDAQRSFVANASHELRGPLTLQRAALEVALADPAATAESSRVVRTCAVKCARAHNTGRSFVDVAHPIRSVVSTLDGPVLEVLARTTRSLTGREIHRLAGTGSPNGVRRALDRLAEQGLVHAEERAKAVFYPGNRDHVAWPARGRSTRRKVATRRCDDRRTGPAGGSPAAANRSQRSMSP